MAEPINSCSAGAPARLVDVAVGVLVQTTPAGPQVLIARRPDHTVLGGLWELPGGKLERGETIQHCLQREFQEELGIEVEVGQALQVIQHAYDHAVVRLYPFFCRHIAGEVRNLAVSEHRWVYPEELDSYQFPAANTSLLAAVREQLKR